MKTINELVSELDDALDEFESDDEVIVGIIARIIHESVREAVNTGNVIKTIPRHPFIEWDELDEPGREGKRMMVRFLLKYLTIDTR